MRREATLDLWRMLHNLAGELKELEPWKDLWDLDLIGIQENGKDEPVFVSVLGKNDECKGLVFYEGTAGLAEFQRIAEREGTAVSMEYLMGDQQSIVLNWGERVEVPAEQKEIIKELGLKYHGKGNWPYVLSYRPRFAAWSPDEAELRMLVETMIQLIEAVKAMREERVKIAFEEGEFCFRYFDGEQLNWMTAPAKLPYVEIQYPELEINDELFLRRLKNQPKNENVIAVDTVYLHGELQNEYFERPVNPLMMLALDGETGTVLATELIHPEDDECGQVAAFLIDYVESMGRPECILARNPKLLAGLSHICAELDINLETSYLLEIDAIVEEMMKDL